MNQSGREQQGVVAVMTAPGKLSFVHYALPRPGPGAVLAAIVRTHICGSERHIWRGLHPTKRSGVLGHEALARVVALGDGVACDFAQRPIAVGDRIVAAYFMTCRRCPPCQEGRFHLCDNAYRYWSMEADEYPHFHGTFASHYYIHPDQYFYKVPDAVPDRAAAGANCALAQVYFGLDQARLRWGETVVVQGLGGLGLSACALARTMGATVIGIDGVAGRLEAAAAFGAHHVIDLREHDSPKRRCEAVCALSNGRGADLVLEVTGVPAALQEAILLARPGARCISIGNISPGQLASFDPGLLTRKSVTIIPVMRYDPWYLDRALQFLATAGQGYPFETLVDAEFTFPELADALNLTGDSGFRRAAVLVA